MKSRIKHLSESGHHVNDPRGREESATIIRPRDQASRFPAVRDVVEVQRMNPQDPRPVHGFHRARDRRSNRCRYAMGRDLMPNVSHWELRLRLFGGSIVPL